MIHQVTFDLHTRDLSKSDIDFTVMGDGETLVKLEVSKGALRLVSQRHDVRTQASRKW